MGIETVHVGINPGYVRAGCKVTLADDEDNDIGSDMVSAWLDDVTFEMIPDGDHSARAQLLDLAQAFAAVGHEIAKALAALPGPGPA